MTRIAIVSDIHGNLAALEAVADDIRRRGVTQVVNLGDSLSGPLLPRQTARWLMASGWLHLAGNHERQILELQPGRGGASDRYAHGQLGSAEFDWLRGLRPSLRLSAEVFLCHGTPRSDCEYFLDSLDGTQMRLATAAEIDERLAGEAAAVVACGHTHLPRSLRHAGRQLLLNPGSVGLQAYQDEHPVVHQVAAGGTDARYALLERRDGGHWQAALLSVPYDHAAMAVLAREHDRPDWAQWLSGGYIARVTHT